MMTKITQHKFSKAKSGEIAKVFRLENETMTVDITNYGATILSIEVPDKRGKMADIVLGYNSVEQYENNGGYFGATVGRYANRIANGEFTLGGITYKLAQNDGKNHLHGGICGFDKKMWDHEIKDNKLVLTTTSADMEEGYPGNLDVSVSFSLNDDNELKIEYFAKTDKDTYVNLTNHSYFNLNGHGKGDILRHKIQINADKYTSVGEGAIPVGDPVFVVGTPFDFTTPHVIGERVSQDNKDLLTCGGYDHNFVIARENEGITQAAILVEEYTGRQITVSTDLPGIQLYIGNMIDPVKGKMNANYSKRSGLCLETQYFPDTPNNETFPSCLVKAGEEQKSTTIFKFSVIENKPEKVSEI
ncbi:MAG: aldose epimerase family protein [Oscillospiraceae bacterium]